MAEIYQALNSDPIDVAALRRMAISEGGLLTDEIRCKVWPKLLSVNTDELPPLPGTERGSEALPHLPPTCISPPEPTWEGDLCCRTSTTTSHAPCPT